MIAIAIDGLDEEDFRRSIETMLRRGDADDAARRLRTLLAPYVGVGRILPPRFLGVSAADLTISGWEGLGERLAQHDRPDHPVTALSIAFGLPPEDSPDVPRTAPWVETGYYSDDSFPFSQSARDDLLDGYSYFGCDWSGDCEASDTDLAIAGIDDLHSALTRLEGRLIASDALDADGIRAGSLGSCYVSVLLFQAVRDTIARHGLPRPLCVLTGCNGVYPYFDAPVAGIEASAKNGSAASGEDGEAEETASRGGSPRYGSLLMSSIPRAKKRAVLVLAETEEETAVRIANLRGLQQLADAPGTEDAKKLTKRLTLHFPEAPEVTDAPEVVEAAEVFEATEVTETSDLAVPGDQDQPRLSGAFAKPVAIATPWQKPDPDVAFAGYQGLPAPQDVPNVSEAPRPVAPKPAAPQLDVTREAATTDWKPAAPGFALLDTQEFAGPVAPAPAYVGLEPGESVFSEAHRRLADLREYADTDADSGEFHWPHNLAWQGEADDEFEVEFEVGEQPAPPASSGLRLNWFARMRAGFSDRLRGLFLRRRG